MAAIEASSTTLNEADVDAILKRTASFLSRTSWRLSTCSSPAPLLPQHRFANRTSSQKTASTYYAPHPRLGLPLEIMGEIWFHAASSLAHLGRISGVCRDIRNYTWGSSHFKARVLINCSKNDKITHSFFAFFALPDSSQILTNLIHSKHISPQSCPRAISLAQPYTNDPSVISTLLKEGFCPESSTMVVAANRGYMDILMALLESQLFSPPSFALTAAAAAGHDSIVAILLAQSNVPVDPLALSASAGAGHLPVVRRLLANRHVRSMDAASLAPAIREACLHGRLDVARCLTEHGIADPIALTNAITRGHTEIVRYLLAQRRRATATTDGEEEGWRGVGVEYAPRKQDWVAAKSKPEIRRLLSGASGRQMWFENLMRTVLRRRGRGSAAL